jgi:hypothetical protein
MTITKSVVIFNAKLEIQELDKRARELNSIINRYKPLIQADNQKAINNLAKEYIRIHQTDILSTDRERAECLITLYEQDTTSYEQSAERTRTLVTKLNNDDEILLRELEELNEKLAICCHHGYDIQICRRLKSLIEKFILTAENSCKQHLSQCKALFPDE